MNTRFLPWLLFGASLLVSLYLFFLLLNAGALIDGATSRVGILQERSNFVLSVIRRDWVGREESSVKALSEELERQGVFAKKPKDESREVGDLIFEIRDGVVVQVRYLD